MLTLRLFGVATLVSVVQCVCVGVVLAQGLGGAGTIQGTVKGPTGGVMQSVSVSIRNPVGIHADNDDGRGR